MSANPTPHLLDAAARREMLTVEKLFAVVDALPKTEIARVIVGAPAVPRDKAMQWISKRVLWMHADVWDAIPKALTDSGSRLFGLPVEFFSWERHGDLWREFMTLFVTPNDEVSHV